MNRTTEDRREGVFGQAGFTLAELIVVVALVGVLATLGSVLFLSFSRTTALRAGAEEMVTVLNRARQLAIKDSTSMCVANDSARVQVRIGGCSGTAWLGPGTDAAGYVRLASAMTVVSAQNVTFTHMGTASVPGSYTVINPRDGRTLSVSVTTAGRVSISQ
jgi:type IV fimbrial biogenesis protein FimT